MADERHLSVILVPDGAGAESRAFRISYRRLRLLTVVAGVLGLLFVVMVGSWWHLATRASRASALEEELAAVEAERVRVSALVARLEEAEERYDALRGLFGSDSAGLPTEGWLPVAGSARSSLPSDSAGRMPTGWPLSARGFVTRPLLAGATGDHPGIDIAIPTDSYVLAAGGGAVMDAGENEIYGRYAVLDHGDGYRTRYAHASRLFVEVGQPVRRGEVIALSGSTGRSTAPHLHFEILLDGEAVDPLVLIQRP